MLRRTTRAADGTIYFNLPSKVTLPKLVLTQEVSERLEQRGGVVDKGIMVEIDLIGEFSRLVPAPKQAEQAETKPEEQQKESLAWLVQVRYTTAAMGIAEIKKFIEQVKIMKAKVGYASVVSWYVCKGGFTHRHACVPQKHKHD